MKSFTSLSYKNITKLLYNAEELGQDSIELYYFVVSSTPNNLKIVRPSRCKISPDVRSVHLNFFYLTPKNNWNKTPSYSFKKSAFYFLTEKEAQDAFKIRIESVKEGFTELQKSVNIALNTLSAY